jgi:hypothetical protein
MKKRYVIETNIDYNIYNDWDLQIYDNNINRIIFYTNNSGYTNTVKYDSMINEYKTTTKYPDGSSSSSVSSSGYKSHFTGP